MHQGDTSRTQKLIHIVDIPRRVAHLEGGAEIAWERREKSREAFVIALEPGRRLEQDRAEPIAERPRAIEEDRKRLGRALQLAHVRDVLRRLEREEKIRRRRLAPGGDVLLGRQVVEGVVDLERPEARGVVVEEVLWLHLRRIEDRLPGGIRPARRADESVPASQRVKETRLCRAD